MYVKRGYIPDGGGVWYGDQAAEPYQTYCNDDDLVLYFSKELYQIQENYLIKENPKL